MESFVEIATKDRSLMVTTEHLLFSGKCNSELVLMEAKKVNIGDCLKTVDGLEVVVSTTKNTLVGVYSVVTTEEYIVVNGIVASPFEFNHYAAHMFYGIHRALFKMDSSILNYEWFGYLHRTVASFAAYMLSNA